MSQLTQGGAIFICCLAPKPCRADLIDNKSQVYLS
jgi:hypothetical protein